MYDRPTWSEAAEEAQLVLATVSDPVARRLLYQARVNIQLYKFLSGHLQKEYDELLRQNYGYAFRSYEREGKRADEQRADSMMLPHERSFGLLVATITAGHRFIRSISNAKSKDRGGEWKALRAEIEFLQELFRRTRNFLEHLDEAVGYSKGEHLDEPSGRCSNGALGCSFDCSWALTCTEEGKAAFVFHFDEKSLERLDTLYAKVIQMLRSRRET